MKTKEVTKKKIQNKTKYSFTIDDYWQVEKLELKKNMTLEILLVSKKTGDIPEDVFVGKTNIGPAYPLYLDYSKKILVRFYQPLAFQRLDESFATEKGARWTGEVRFRTFTESEYLKYFSKVSYGIVDKPILHYCISCSDDIVSVLTTDPPEIIPIKSSKKKSSKPKKKKPKRR